MENNIAVVILAAGLGTRMKSDKAKVLHEVAGKAMILYVVETARKAVGDDIVVVVGHQAQKVREILSESDATPIQYAYQEQQLGTAHAVSCALPHIPEHCNEIVILYGDTPLIMPETIAELVEDHLEGSRHISLLAVELKNPYGYGRVLLDNNKQVSEIIEEKDASDEQKKIELVNSGIYCVNKQFLQDALPKIQSDNAQKELYLTDIMAIGYQEKKKTGALVVADYHQILGVNSSQDLEAVSKIMKTRMRNIS